MELLQPESLVDLIAVQPGSIVSRILMKSKSGSLTLFAFAENEGLSEHVTPFEARLFILQGMTTVTVDGTVHEVGNGQSIRLPANVPHAVHATTDAHLLLFMLRA